MCWGMTGQFITSLVGILFGLIGLSALMWAISQRQFRAAEATRYAVREDEPDYSNRKPASRWSRRISMVVLAVIFATIFLSPLITVVAAMSAGPHPAAGTGAAKCPFSFGK